MSILVWLPQTDKLVSKDYKNVSQYVSLDDSWEITINGRTYHNVSLDQFRFDAIGKGGQIIMQRVLPEDWGITEGALRLHIRQTAVDIYIDGVLVYEYGHDRIGAGKTVGSGFQFINFPKEYYGKTMKICLYLSEDKAFSKLDPIRIYEWENAYRALITENRIPLFLGSFLVIFGLSTAFITIFALVFSTKYIRLFCISIFSICMGLWTLCYYNVMLIFAIPLYSISLLEYISLYLSPIPLTIYLREDVKNLGHKFSRTAYWILLAALILAASLFIALHSADIVHFAATLKYMQALIICCLAYFFFVVFANLKANRAASNRLFLVGMLVIGICITYDLASYLGNRYYGSTSLSLKGVSSIGMMIFVFILILSFYISITKKMMQETERNSLIKSAYTDELTQLHNRRYCIEYMNKIKERKDLDYTIICFDLNYLKETNDTYGHARGDVLIKTAADVIAETFEPNGMVARMGGDEFIAIVHTSDPEKIGNLIKVFHTNTDKKNQELKDLNMSIAYGGASSNGTETDIEKVYQLADDRMYEKKRQMKGAMGDNGIADL